jgi:hypothetical protein
LFALLEGTLTLARIHDGATRLIGLADRAVEILKFLGGPRPDLSIIILTE